MGRQNAALQAFNRGEIGKLALGRIDVDRLRLSAEQMVNWVPHTVGPMSLRPGLAYTGTVKGVGRSYDLPFVFGINDTAILELTDHTLRVVIDDQVVTRPNVSAEFRAGAMKDASLWNLTLRGGGVVSFANGDMTMSGASIGGSATATALLITNTIGTEHALRIVVGTGPITMRLGYIPGADDAFPETTLAAGVHSIAFTPGGNVYVTFETQSPLNATVVSATLEAPGPLEIATPWTEAQLPFVRSEQSGDVTFVACPGVRQMRIERRSRRSWSVVNFDATDGPFQAFRTKNARLVFEAGIGLGRITASREVFKPSLVGSLVRGFTPDNNHVFKIGGSGSYMPSVRVAGVGIDRSISYSVSGEFSGTWELQRSITAEDTGFTSVLTGTGPFSAGLADGLDNTIAWYRLGLKDHAGGVASVQIIRSGGGRTGVARIVAYINPVEVIANTLTPFSSNTATEDWRLGDWSDAAGWPSAVALHDGRLCFAGRDRFWASVSDAYGSFAETFPDGSTVGDASAISRSIGYGPVAVLNWLLPLSRLIAGAEGSEISIRSSALDAPLTPTGGVTIKDCSTQGSARVAAAKVDTRGLFVQKSRQRLYQLAYDVNSQDYQAADMMRLHPDLCLGNPILRIAVQRQPNTRIHCVRADGTVAVLTFEPGDEVEAWWRIETDGAIEDVVVLPDAIEDRVYYTVRRTVGGAPVRYRERFARMDQARGGPLSRISDAHVLYQGAPTATIGGLAHLEGREVVAWADSDAFYGLTVKGGQITLPAPVTTACVGLPYEARFKSAKLAYAAQGGTALHQIKRVVKVGVTLAYTHPEGLRFGPDFEELDDLPLVEGGEDVDLDQVHEAFDEPMIEFPGDWDTDARLCLEAAAPLPATVMACSITVETNG